MRYVVLRDDDTNALTPVDCLEMLYRPFLQRKLPVNLAVIPEVCTKVKMPNGRPEGFLLGKNGAFPETLPIACNGELVKYLTDNPGYHFAQHGCHHRYFEFDNRDAVAVRHLLQYGARLLEEAGLPAQKTFVAPYDKLSPASLKEVARRFRVLSTGWFELRRLPIAWWPRYLMKKFSRRPHWQAGKTFLLTHPGCLLSCYRDFDTMLGNIQHAVQSNHLTVLVTHWWEYFRKKQPDAEFIQILHKTAEFLDNADDVRVVSFDAIAAGEVPLA